MTNNYECGCEDFGGAIFPCANHMSEHNHARQYWAVANGTLPTCSVCNCPQCEIDKRTLQVQRTLQVLGVIQDRDPGDENDWSEDR